MSVVILGAGIILVTATNFSGIEIKGASRWLSLGGFTFQPSEFVKPCFAVVAAWMFAEYRQSENFPGRAIASALLLIVVALLLLQPDFGMAVTVAAVWFVQFFLAGLSLWWVGLSLAATLGLVTAAYSIFPHVAKRVVREADLFVLLAVAGLLTQFGLQALINMGVTVQLLPAKGMTLPFVSYGGSSLIASALGMGMVLALTRSGYRDKVSAA